MIRIKESTTGREVYFRNEEDANAYLHVFKDHWCNLKWSLPVVVRDSRVPSKYTKYIDTDPKERAEADLSWGFALMERNNMMLSSEQKNLVEELVDKFTTKNGR